MITHVYLCQTSNGFSNVLYVTILSKVLVVGECSHFPISVVLVVVVHLLFTERGKNKSCFGEVGYCYLVFFVLLLGILLGESGEIETSSAWNL